MNRTRAVIGTALAGVTFIAATSAQGAATPVPQTGSATTQITLPRLAITDVIGQTHLVSLGALTSSATTVGSALAAVRLGGVDVLGSTSPEWSVETADGTKSGDLSRSVSTPLVSGGLSLGGYGVTAGPDAATSTLDALSGSLATGELGATLDLGQHGLSSSAGRDASAAALSLTTTGAKVGLGDLLPAGVLDALPLSQLVTLVQSLQLPVPTAVTNALTTLTNLRTLLTSVRTTAGQLLAAQQNLAGLLAGVPATQAAQQTLTDAQQQLQAAVSQLTSGQQQLTQDQATVQSLQNQVATATATVAGDQTAVNTAAAQVAGLQAALAGNPLSLLLQQQLAAAQTAAAAAQSQLTAAQSQLAALQQQLTAAAAAVTADQQQLSVLQQAVTTAQSAANAAQSALDALSQAVAAANQLVATAQQTVDSLVTTITSLLTQVTSLVPSLPDLHALVMQLLDLVTSAPLVNLGTVGMTVSSVADQSGGTGTVTCSATGLSIVGQPLPSGPCNAVGPSLSSAASTLHGVLAALPGASLVPMPTLTGLAATTAGVPAATDDVSSAASAGLTPLHLSLPSLSLQAVTDTVVSSLDATLSQLSSLLPQLGLANVTTALSGPLGTLAVSVGSLPTGSSLAGLRTLGLDLSLAGLTTSVLHNRVLPAGVTPNVPNTPKPPTVPHAPGTPGTPGTPRTPVTPGSPQHPSGSPSGSRPSSHQPGTAHLPFTGSDNATELAVAALMLVLGAHLTLLGRRRRSA